MEGSLSRCVLRCERYVQKVVGSGLDRCPGCLGSSVLRTLQGVAWFLVFWVLALTWAIVFWVVILPRWQKAQPLARKYAAPPTRTADINEVAFWQRVGAIRLPSE